MKYGLGEFKFNSKWFQKFLESNVLLYCVVLVLALKIVAVGILINFPQNIFFADITRNALINFVNQGRGSAGLNPLLENEKLDRAAELKAKNMVQNQYFSHTSPTGITPWQWFLEAGYDYKYAGENLAVGFYDSEEVYNAWLNSPSHKENLLNPNYKEIGTAVLGGFGQNNAIVVVQFFGSSLNVNNSSISVNEPASKVVEKEKTEKKPIGLQMVLGKSEGGGINNLYSKFLNYMLYSYDGLLQTVVYGFSLILIGILAGAILLGGGGLRKDLVLRSFIAILVLLSAALLNREAIISIIPHQIII